MLFTKYIQESRYNEMNRIEAEIARLQQLLTDIQAATQTDLALEQMADSAIEQLAIATNNILLKNPELRPYLKEAALRILDSDLPVGLLEGGSGNPSNGNTPASNPPATGSDANPNEDSDGSDDPDDDNDPPTSPTRPSGGGEEAAIDVDVVTVDSDSDEDVSANTNATITNTPVVATATETAKSKQKKGSSEQGSGLPVLPPAIAPVELTQETGDNEFLTEEEVKQLPKPAIDFLAKQLGIKIRTQSNRRLPKALAEVLTWGFLKDSISAMNLPISVMVVEPEIECKGNQEQTEPDEQQIFTITQAGSDYDTLSKEEIEELPEYLCLHLAGEWDIPNSNKKTKRLTAALTREGITWACLKKVVKDNGFAVEIEIANNANKTIQVQEERRAA